ncbi:MAG: hypothetical protein HXX08_22710 [Chloroflexi bacterium]|uniref:Helix-hairpin-helix domain-containing protein n=1 Tax=Candidatus Chlorohelix allophototropha TaxID=3003348 RepID=A0A8T7M9S3_9CHLR|nr:hypothetical protein [Chloroflexota bacterium]WJW68613.1 hypothetical protein OZ401_004227 [Chloroflexota bacterium L227-S17]
MGNRRTKSDLPDEPQKGDDFKQIHGIGPSVETRLQKAGILTYSQFALLSPADVAALLLDIAGMTAERIAKQDWIGQARALAPGNSPVERFENPVSKKKKESYAIFTLEMLLDEQHIVQRMSVVNVLEGLEETWDGWNETWLREFISRSANLSLPETAPAPRLSKGIREVKPVLEGEALLETLEAVPTHRHNSNSVFRSGEPYIVSLNLDLSKVVVQPTAPLKLSAVVKAKSLSGGNRYTLCEATETAEPGSKASLKMNGVALKPGLYRTEAVVTLITPESINGLTTKFEGSLFQIY